MSNCQSQCPDQPGLVCVINHAGDMDTTDHYAAGFRWTNLGTASAGPRCYHPQLSHAACPAGHPVHLDVDHYADPTWVHCLIRDVVACPHDYEDITGAALPGKHRTTR